MKITVDMVENELCNPVQIISTSSTWALLTEQIHSSFACPSSLHFLFLMSSLCNFLQPFFCHSFTYTFSVNLFAWPYEYKINIKITTPQCRHHHDRKCKSQFEWVMSYNHRTYRRLFAWVEHFTGGSHYFYSELSTAYLLIIDMCDMSVVLQHKQVGERKNIEIKILSSLNSSMWAGKRTPSNTQMQPVKFVNRPVSGLLSLAVFMNTHKQSYGYALVNELLEWSVVRHRIDLVSGV